MLATGEHRAQQTTDGARDQQTNERLTLHRTADDRSRIAGNRRCPLGHVFGLLPCFVHDFSRGFAHLSGDVARSAGKLGRFNGNFLHVRHTVYR